jgi:hypothetical protein
MVRLAYSSLLLVLLIAPVGLAKEPGVAVAQRRPRGNDNFLVRSYRGGPAAQEVLQRCERLRGELRRRWLATEGDVTWDPRCEVVLHRTRSQYLEVVGKNAGQTSGASLIRFQAGRVALRRLDLLVDGDGQLPALAHELTHVVLADRFAGRQPPRWVDEGIATLADSAEKRLLHHRDCENALRGGTALRMIDVLTLDQFTSPEQVPAFYGQSLSLVSFLTQRDRPSRVVEFAATAMNAGYDRALQEHYGIDGVAGLERRWRQHLVAAHQNATHSPVLAVGILP